jgi:hypothetical protein
VLTRWLEQGAPYEGPAAPTSLATQRVAQWERFFMATRSRRGSSAAMPTSTCSSRTCTSKTIPSASTSGSCARPRHRGSRRD